MFMFLISIIAIQINLFASSNMLEIRITFNETFNLYYSNKHMRVLVSAYTVTVISKISKNAHWKGARYNLAN